MKLYLLFLLTATAIFSSISAENYLDGAESVVYDSDNDRYLVTSIRTSSIIAVDPLGNQTPFAQGLGICYSNHLDGGIVYYSSGSYVRGLDLYSAEEVFTVFCPSTGGNLDGLTSDTSGNIYVVDPNGRKIYMIDIALQTASVFVSSGLPPSPQDLTFDATHNRLYMCSYTSQAPIIAFDLPDPTPVVKAITEFGFHDGIMTDGEGNIFVSAPSRGAVYRYDSAFSRPPDMIVDGLVWPTGTDYNAAGFILAIPDFELDTITFLDLSQPDFDLVGCSVAEAAGDGDGVPDAGEEVEIYATIHNYRQKAEGVYSEIQTSDPYINIDAASATYGDPIPWHGEATTATPLVISVLSSAPDPHIALLEVYTRTADGYSTMDTILVFIGNRIDLHNDCESGEGFWKHKTLTHQSRDDWHLEDFRFVSGSTSWKAGGNDGANYSDNSDGILLTPPFLLSTNSILRFSHWIDAEAMMDGARDGGLIYLVTAAGDITQLDPIGGYPDSFFASPNFTIPEGTPCFSGSHGWDTAEFDLSFYTGVGQIMFRFASNSAISREGWYIDDIEVIGDPLYTCGDANGDDAVNVGDAVYLANYVFRNADCPINPPIGCPPDPEEAGDVNCDGNVNIGDAVYLVNFVFKQGAPEPGAGCP